MVCCGSADCPGINNWHHISGGCPGPGSTCFSNLVQGTNMDRVWINRNINLGGARLGGGNTMLLENWQRCVLEDIVGCCVPKSGSLRLSDDGTSLRRITRPNSEPEPFIWSEDFDGRFNFQERRHLVNFKLPNSTGGNQSRTAKLLYHFFMAQIRYLNANPQCTDVFLNILDGDHISGLIPAYQNVLTQNLNAGVNGRIFVGDSYTLNRQWPNV